MATPGSLPRCTLQKHMALAADDEDNVVRFANSTGYNLTPINQGPVIRVYESAQLSRSIGERQIQSGLSTILLGRAAPFATTSPELRCGQQP